MKTPACSVSLPAPRQPVDFPVRTDPDMKCPSGLDQMAFQTPAWQVGFQFLGRSMAAKSRVKPAGIVDLIYEPWQPPGYVDERFVSGRRELFDL
jgi:hypothetical protein